MPVITVRPVIMAFTYQEQLVLNALSTVLYALMPLLVLFVPADFIYQGRIVRSVVMSVRLVFLQPAIVSAVT